MMDEYRDDRGNKWRASAAGEAFDNWMNDWQGLDPAEAQMPTLPELEEIAPGNLADDLDNLPVEPSE